MWGVYVGESGVGRSLRLYGYWFVLCLYLQD
jgi:hypothetical protein